MIKISLLLSLSLLACGGKKDDSSGGGTATGKTTETKSAPSGPFADFGSTDDILQKWQGAWVLETGSLGNYEAWEVKGNAITAWDGKAEKTYELQIDSPCSGQAITKGKDGSKSGSGLTFVFEGDKLHTGMGDAGFKKGDKYLACGAGKIFVFDGKTCEAHENFFGKWEHKPTECKIENGKFIGKSPGMGSMTSEQTITGDLLMTEQMKGNKTEKAASYAEAKTKLETFKK